MIVVLALFGVEVFRLELGTPAGDDEQPHPDLIAVNRHAGEFGFGGSPARPYWSHDPDEAPAVARRAQMPAS